ncbi:hypothetical protein BDV26DRAFT_289963 [Aspergillus bertholletiae]|uniref:Uncharacterized protein n=1 Tax=Aspergillus bertholletiae TaxID=1226010 RepID=A0A5N7BGI2_9EURO|nr:hypothetical protein BDV26DRAFT_289963 [Aspergillus bertholletiae]
MNSSKAAPPPFIYINGYPGSRETHCGERVMLLPKAKVVSNHFLINAAAAVFDRDAEGYQPLRQVLVHAQHRKVLKFIATAQSTHDTTWIFTDQQSSNVLGSSSARDYQNAAALCGSPFSSIILNRSLEENLQMAAKGDRGRIGSNTKLTDPSILRHSRENEDIFHFRIEYDLTLDVTSLSPSEAAGKVYEHIGTSCS